MAIRFQDQLGDSLRAYPGAYTYHPPDGMASQYKPADWIICYHGRYLLVEAKQLRTQHWNFKYWPPQQRGFCQQALEAGGEYALVVNWRGPAGEDTGKSYAGVLFGEEALQLVRKQPGLYKAEVPRRLTWRGTGRGGWDVLPIFERLQAQLLAVS